MRVAFIYPEVYDLARFKENRKEFPPFGVMYLAAVVERAGMSAAILKVNERNVALDLREFDVVAFSIPSSATYGLMRKARFASAYSGHALLLVGGVHPSFYPEKTFIDWDVHAVATGEGEESILELIARAKDRDFSKVSGVCYRSGGSLVRKPERPLMKDIDSLPLPARHLLEVDDFVMDDRLADTDVRMAHVMLSRGCPFPCRFCAAAQTKIQYRSGRNVRAELIHLKEKYNVEGFAIVDDNFVVNKTKVADICVNITDLGLRWSALSRVDTVDEALLTAMRKAGCIEVKFGVESGSQRILDAMDKRITPEDICTTLELAQKVGIGSKIFIIHGFPGEDMASTKETIALLERLSSLINRVSLFRFVPLPGTYVYQHPDEFQLHGTDTDPRWDGDWSKYHIHHNDHHWWGAESEFTELNESYELLRQYVDTTWPDRHTVPTE